MIIGEINILLVRIHNSLLNETNILVSNYYSTGILMNDPNFSSRKINLDNKINLVKKYINYTNKEINNYINIKTEIKNIDKIFLTKIKNISYTN